MLPKINMCAEEVLCVRYIWREELLIKFSVRFWSSPAELCGFQGSEWGRLLMPDQ